MPIYAYRCTSCGHAKDVLQKVSDPLLTDCPACGAATFTKQVTAAGFQLKGSGWYVTDFRGGNTVAGKPEGGEAADGEKPADKATEKPAEKTEKTTDDKAAAKPAKAAEGGGDKSASPPPAPAPASAPAVTAAAPAAGPKPSSSSPPPATGG